jgi:hypothetical protein
VSLGIVGGEGCVREVVVVPPVGHHDFDLDFGKRLRMTRTVWLVLVAKLLYYWGRLWCMASNLRCISSRRWSLHS